MASSASPFEATDGPVLSLVDKRLRALIEKHERILRMEESIASGKPINKEQEDVLRSKPFILDRIGELSDLRPDLCSALKEELSLATQRLPRNEDISATPQKVEANDNAAANDGTAGGASSTHTSTEAPGHDFEVFLSFRGSDVRAGFVNFLYTCLNEIGIRTFKDDERLRVGEKFEPNLLQAIEDSKILIPIFSKDYASSPWCLKEVVKMVECQKTKGQKIKPIFYDVPPAMVRHPYGDYAAAFSEHKRKGRHDDKTMQDWRDALRTVADINGWDLHSLGENRREGDYAKRIAQEVFKELKKADLVISDCFVSVDNHVNKIKEMIDAGTSETRIIGIHGMGGIGKTTIAKKIYNELSKDFKYHCFLSDIREVSKSRGIEYLQHQLIAKVLNETVADVTNIDDGTKTIEARLHTKRVLLLFDDVGQKKHMDALVGKRNWFGTGSKLIITTRNKEVIEVPQVNACYMLDGMTDAQSLELFSKHAFGSDSPPVGYMDQSIQAIHIARGLPLSLEVIGSLLCHTEKGMWNATLKMLESVPHDKVQGKLKVSYDALDFRQKRIFLDIACLFIGYDKDILVHYWDESILYPDEAMKVLKNMALIKIVDGNKVWMHDHLRDLGRELVHEKSDMKTEKQSRIWDSKEGLNLLRRHKGKKKVEALRLKLDDQRQYCFTYEDFESLSHLRFLEVENSMGNFCAQERHLWHESPSQENSHLLPQLRWLSWHNILPTFEITNFSMEDLVFLDLSHSEIKDDWKGWKHMEVMKNLKVLNLSDCDHLERIPNLSAHLNLERLILMRCASLIEIDVSICKLKRLISLDLTACFSLQSLPDKLGGGPTSLVYLSLRYCCSLYRLPDSIGNLESLAELDMCKTSIEQLPNSIGKLKNLKVLNMAGIGIDKIPDEIWTIEGIEEIEFSRGRDVPVNVIIGEGIHRNQSLRILSVTLANIDALPPRLPESLVKLELGTLCMHKCPNLSNLTNLKELALSFKYHDSNGPVPVEDPIPGWIGNLTKLEYLSLESYFPETPSTKEVCLPPQLKSLSLWCPELLRLPRLPSSLSFLSVEAGHSLSSIGDLSHLKNLSSLEISYANFVEIQGLGCLENLVNLSIYSLGQMKILNLSNLNKLRSLKVRRCPNLVEIQGKAPWFLDSLIISSCRSLEKLPYLSSLVRQQNVSIDDCPKLNVEAILTSVKPDLSSL